MEDLEISDEEYYDPQFYQYASNEIIEANYPFIGEVVSVFNSIENDLNEDLIEFINDEIPEIGWIVISEMQFSSKFELWKKLASFIISKITPQELKAQFILEFTEVSRLIKEACSQRNKIAHADWDNINEKLFAKTKTKMTKDIRIVHNHLKIDKLEFEKIIIAMSHTENLLLAFSKKLIALL